MGVYRQSVITNVGRSLAARVLAENKSMIFTQVKTSEYAYLEGTNIPSLTDLRDIVQAAAPSSAQVFNNSMVQVSARFDNDKIPRKYRIETIGLYARMDGEDDDILFSVNQAETPDEMPEHSDVSPSAFIYNIQVTIQNASEISFTTNPAGTATVQDILDLEFPQFDDSGGATGISSFPDFINRIKNKMDIYQFYRDLKSGLGYVLHKGQLVNNCESTATDKPLAAAVGKTLWDKIMETVSALAAHKTSGDHDGRYYTETEMDSKLGGKSDTGHTHDDRYYTETEVDNKLSGKSDTNHSHDSRYYTESEMDTKLNGKANSSHTHDDRYYTESEMNAKLSGKSDTSHGHSGMLTTSDIVNNCTSTATNKPLAAAQGKVLMDKYNQLNSDKVAKGESPLYFRGAITGSLNRTDIPPGYYCVGASGTISNGVVGTTDSYCLFIQFGDSYKTQMIIDGSGPHTRSYIGSPVTWTAWTRATSSGYASINTTYVTKVSTTEVRWFKMGNVVLVNLYDINLKAGYSTDNVAVIATGFPRAATSCVSAFPASDGSQFRTMLDGSTLKPWFNGTSKAVSISGSFMYISI